MKSPFELGQETSSVDFLPAITPHMEALRFAFGTVARLLIRTTVFCGTGLVKKHFMKQENAVRDCEEEAVQYGTAMFLEQAVSFVVVPARYIAAVTAPRLMLDFLSNQLSDALSLVDGFRPGRFASFAVYAFAGSPDEDWNFDFFTWQGPAIGLTLAKLLVRRHRLGAKQCKVKKVLGVLAGQVLVRAYLGTFSINIPESASEAVGAVLIWLLEGALTASLAAETHPFTREEIRAFLDKWEGKGNEGGDDDEGKQESPNSNTAVDNLD
ncbi:hypothetical protein STCU_04501 [Strigomonas culicis]|uniref:Uncharacterized protein n=1 Tax=Strigomonas culicis TaxID=28005 RepID=S9U5W7_9TRYP|nr:hypothetical protein STCU_07329 [Strigomonas culicis]EPY29520.1 hypothetical protein STCU_04501 [Strigomonas culicis]|eukprot:EPY24109.1 hypothetical protein STCU_07329 [Strigomonas culicis]